MARTSFRGKTFSDEDVRRAMERFDRERRGTFNRWRTYAIKYEGRDYPPKEILRMVVGDIGNLSGGEPTNHYFRELGFEIGEISDELVSTETAIEDAIDTSLSLESDLGKYLLADLSQLEPGLRLYNENGLSGQQLDAQAAGRIDILAVDKDNNLVVIELKAGEADRQVCGQIQAYMGWVEESLAGSRKVRGIIIANEFSERLRLAAKMGREVSLKRYRVSFKFTDF